MKNTTNKAERSGIIRTLKGRICHFDMWEPLTFNTGTPKKLEDAQKEYTCLACFVKSFYQELHLLICVS